MIYFVFLERRFRIHDEALLHLNAKLHKLQEDFNASLDTITIHYNLALERIYRGFQAQIDVYANGE